MSSIGHLMRIILQMEVHTDGSLTASVRPTKEGEQDAYTKLWWFKRDICKNFLL